MRHIEGLVGCIVVGLGFGLWDVPDTAEQAMVIEVVAISSADALGHDRCRQMTSAL
jgi:hypothetical protein